MLRLIVIFIGLSFLMGTLTSCNSKQAEIEKQEKINVFEMAHTQTSSSRQGEYITIGEHFELDLDLEIGSDYGQSLGTIFEIKNDDNKVVMAAGFPDCVQTKLYNNNRILTFYLRTGDESIEITPMTKPFADGEFNIRLIDFNNCLLAFSYSNSNLPVKQYDDDKATWLDWNELKNKHGDFRGLQVVNNIPLLYFSDRVEYDGRVLLTTTSPDTYFFYHNSKLIVFQRVEGKKDSHQCLIYYWNPYSLESPQLKQQFNMKEKSGHPYVVYCYNNEILISTRYGYLYRIKNGSISFLFRNPGISWTIYSMLRWCNTVLMGHYPSGGIFVYDGQSLIPTFPNIPVSNQVLPIHREAQTLALYRGEIFAGIWPWGELWSYDPWVNQWIFRGRLFKDPPMSRIDAPFVDRFYQEPYREYNNRWGQRITSLVTYRDSLIAIVNNKGWKVREKVAFLTPDIIAQYNSLYRIILNHQISSQIVWRFKTNLKFCTSPHSIKIIQDGQMLCEKIFDKDINLPSQRYKLFLGDGLYGTFKGKIEIKKTRKSP